MVIHLGIVTEYLPEGVETHLLTCQLTTIMSCSWWGLSNPVTRVAVRFTTPPPLPQLVARRLLSAALSRPPELLAPCSYPDFLFTQEQPSDRLDEHRIAQ